MTERTTSEQASRLYQAAEIIIGDAPLIATGRLRQPVRSLLILAPPNSPTFDYFLAPRFGDRCPVRVMRSGLGDDPDRWLSAEGADGTFVLFCRYLSSGWLRAVERTQERLAGVGLFIDDDIPALIAEETAPFAYRAKLVLNHLRHRRRLSSLLDFVFVSTEALAARESQAHPVVIGPVASLDDEPLPATAAAAGSNVRIAFHSTASHASEHAWLAPVMKAVLAQHPHAVLDVYVNRATRSYWQGLDRAEITPVLPWSDYRVATRERRADVLLAPQFPTAVNAARAPTKRIDALRMGAALISNAAGVYSPNEAEVSQGFVLPFDREAWIDGISRLIGDRTRIAKLAELNAKHVKSWTSAPIAELRLGRS